MSGQIDLFARPTPPPSADAAALAATPMLAVSLTQPWASLVALGKKTIETRSWTASHRGPIAIHAAKGFPGGCQALCAEEPFRAALAGRTAKQLPRGLIVAVARLDSCWRFPEAPDPFGGRPHAEHEIDFGDYTPGRFGFVLTDIVPLPEPVPAKGALSIWRIPDDVRALIAAQIGRRAA